MNLTTNFYTEQKVTWPTEGRCILAHFDDNSVVVYQAYNRDIGHFAAQHGYFGGTFSFSRMSWFKPNFLWIMYRSGWGTKENQQVTLAVRIARSFFESVLAQAIPSTFDANLFADGDEWKRAVAHSDVRLQWDPDHSPVGGALKRRAIQLGLRGAALREYGRDAVLGIEDISDFVAAQREHVLSGNLSALLTPSERVYTPADPETTRRLGLTA